MELSAAGWTNAVSPLKLVKVKTSKFCPLFSAVL